MEPRPDAGVRGEATPPEGVGGLGVDERRVMRFDFLEDMILRDTPVEYRLRPRKRAAIRHDSVRNLKRSDSNSNSREQLPLFKPVKLFDYLTYFDKIV